MARRPFIEMMGDVLGIQKNHLNEMDALESSDVYMDALMQLSQQQQQHGLSLSSEILFFQISHIFANPQIIPY